MSRVLVTGSSTGLGLGAAHELLSGGHDVILHARSRARAGTLGAVAERAVAVITGDLGEPDQIRDLADQVNEHGPLDAVIHNAGVDGTPTRAVNADGLPLVFAVNVVAPYLLTALIERPRRLIYLSSDMHTGGRDELDDLDWTRRRWNGTQAYCDSKLLVAVLAFAIAARWSDTRSNAVDPGWVPTRMGGRAAPDDLVLGHRTQAWLAVSDDADADTTGRYWYHQHIKPAAGAAHDPRLQGRLLERLAALTGTTLP